MKKNKINIILISVVVSIWLLVTLKATGNLFSKEETLTGADDTAIPNVQSPQKLTNEKLHLNYRDPFLGNSTKLEVKVQTGNSSPRIKNQKNKIDKPLAKEIPPIKFFGLIRNTGTNKMVAIVSVNNQEKRMLPGESFNDIKLEKITRDSILVSWGKNKLYVKK
jgi:hypothetical protein